MADQDTFLNGIEILDTTPATSSSGSLYTFGGISILSTTNATTTAASFLTLGGSYIVGNTIIGGNTQILSTTISTNTTTGAFIVNGGIGISGNVFGTFANFSNIQAITGATLPNLITTNASIPNLTTTNATIPNLNSSNLIATTSATIPNLIVNNASIGNLSLTTFNPSNITTSNLVVLSSTSIANSIIVNNTVTNSFITNSTVTNSFITNLNTTNLSVNSLNLTNLTSTNAFFTNMTTTNLVVTTNANIAGMTFQYYTGIPSGSWINLPIGAGAATGIGHGGPGASPWVAYAGNAGYWFTNSIAGDICYRNVSGSLQFGTDAGISVIQIANRITTFNDTINSTTTSTGALIIAGGLAVQKNLNIGGNTIISGNLTVNGTTVSVNSTTVNISDNIIVLNSGPSGTADGGILINRFQITNNTGLGDIVNDTVALAGTVQTGTTTSVVVLPGGASAVDSFYNNYWIKITSGTANNNVRQIVSYVGATRTATLSSVLTATPTANTDTFNLYGNVFVANYFKESLNEFTLAYTSSTPGSVITDVTFANLRLGNLTSVLVSTSNLLATNATITNFTLPSNITVTNLVSTNSSLGSLIGTNLNFTNATITNFTLPANVTFSNLVSTNSSFGSAFGTNLNFTNVSISNLRLANVTFSNLVSTNISSGSIFGTNIVSTNSSSTNLISTNGSIANAIGINLNYTNITHTNLLGTNSTISNSVGINLNYTNITVANLQVPNLIISNLSLGNLVVNSVTAQNFLMTGITSASNILSIDCQASQTFPGQLVFINSGGTGDFRIYGDGGDVQWQGGGGRACQMGAYHELRLLGGRAAVSTIPFVNGSNSTFNTIIQNTNDSIALRVQANSTQTVDLQQWTNNSGIVYCKVDAIGNLVINSTADTVSSITGGSITTSGGVSIAKGVDIGSTSAATNVSTGALVVSGGAGFNGDIYAKNIYTNGILLNPFGSEYNYVELLSSSGTTAITYTQRVSMTTSSLLGGSYKINVGYNYEDLSSTSADATFLGLLDASGLSTGTLIHEFTDRSSRNTFVQPQYTSVTRTLTAGIHRLSLIFKSQTAGQSVFISNATLELFRVQ